MKQRALLIGINNYRDINPLRGCVNDTTNLRLILKDVAGFDADQIRMLVDARATKAAIEQRIQWLVKDAVAGDLLVLHFAGHGSQIRDRGEQDELIDRLDEILCPWDMDWDATFINDDYLDSVLEVPEGVVLEVILDCCNSGDAGVELGFARSESAPGPRSDRQPRFAQPPADIASRQEGRDLPQRKLLERREPSHLALWSACGDSQTADDARIDGIPNGAFTFYFCKHMRDARGALARAELLERVKSSLRQAGHAQVPELAAPPDFSSERPFTPRRRPG